MGAILAHDVMPKPGMAVDGRVAPADGAPIRAVVAGGSDLPSVAQAPSPASGPEVRLAVGNAGEGACATGASYPVILFGAFDRHNFGDLLLAQVAEALLRPRPVVFAGLAERDLTAWGGQRVQALLELAREWGERPADLLQVGGEVLTCPVYEAAVMLLGPDDAQSAIARYDRDPAARRAWAQDLLGLDRQVAYLAPRCLFHNPRRFVCHAVGGVDLARLPESMQAEVCAELRSADRVSVRDRFTLEYLAEAGIAAELTPDPAVLTAELFGPCIAEQAAGGEPAMLRERFPNGYLAVQFSADFGDDASLQTLAAQLDRVVAQTGLGICLFRAGAAPWHDDPEVYRRLAGFLTTQAVHRFESLHLWAICALLAGAAGYCGTSLHGRMVAEAFGVPALNLISSVGLDHAGVSPSSPALLPEGEGRNSPLPQGEGRERGKTAISKTAAYALTWDADGFGGVASVDAFADALLHRLASDRAGRLDHARHLAGLARMAGEALRASLS